MTQLVDLSRRSIIKTGLITTLCLASQPALALPRPTSGMKELAFYNLHTDEKLRVTYWKDGKYDRTALSRVNHVLRDFRTGDVYPMSANLIDLLHDLQMKLRTDALLKSSPAIVRPRPTRCWPIHPMA